MLGKNAANFFSGQLFTPTLKSDVCELLLIFHEVYPPLRGLTLSPKETFDAAVSRAGPVGDGSIRSRSR